MRMLKSGRSVAEIRDYVDEHYSQFGLSTDTDPV